MTSCTRGHDHTVHRDSRVACSEGEPVADYDEPALKWRKSTRSNSGHCLEVAAAGGVVHLRDSKRPDGPIVPISARAWLVFVAELRASQ
ncbi:MAG: DUF397 domain-containing protein [Trebonia sp.]